MRSRWSSACSSNERNGLPVGSGTLWAPAKFFSIGHLSFLHSACSSRRRKLLKLLVLSRARVGFDGIELLAQLGVIVFREDLVRHGSSR